MRRLLLYFLTIFAVQVSWAAPVSQQQASNIARKFLTSKGLRPLLQSAPTFAAPTRGGKAVPWYAYNAEDKGFVIVSGDDRTAPVLAYSLEGSFSWDTAPENMKAFLQRYANEIAWLQDNNITVNKTKNTRATTDRATIAPMLQTKWDQDEPYNNACPLFFSQSNGRCVTGCVATAMAQVLYYNYQQHPDRMVTATQAEIPAYQCSTNWQGYGHISIDSVPANSPIDWNNMLPEYTSGATDAQTTAIANLMAWCGASIKMNYANNANGGSGTSVASVQQALIKYFGFDASTTYASQSNYSLADWNDLIYNELANNRVVLYGGQSSSGSGHAFVINGYEGENFFDVDWGWGGMSNGAFLLSVLDPSSVGTGGGNVGSGYNQDMDAIINAEPNHNGTQALGLSTRDFSITNNNISVGFMNSGVSDGTFDIGFATRDSDGTLTVLGNRPVRLQTVDGSMISYKTYDLDVSSSLTTDGTYQITPVAKVNGTSEWQDLWSKEHYVQVIVSGGVVTSIMEMPTQHLSASNLVVGPTRITYKLCNISATVSNEDTERFDGALYLFASTTSDKGSAVAIGSASIEAGSSTEVAFSWMPETAGTYTIWLCSDTNGQNVLTSISDIVIEQGTDDRQRIALTALNVNGSDASTEYTDNDGRTVTHVNGNSITGTYTINAVMALDSVDIFPSLFKYDPSTNTYNEVEIISYSYSKLTMSQGTSINLDFSFNGLSDGKYMLKIAAGTFNTQSIKIDPEIWSDDSHCYEIGEATAISSISKDYNNKVVNIYNIKGVLIGKTKADEVSTYLHTLPHDVYIVNGKKVINR